MSWPDTKRDQLALGFRTTQSDAVLVRIASGSSTDYIELELVRFPSSLNLLFSSTVLPSSGKLKIEVNDMGPRLFI